MSREKRFLICEECLARNYQVTRRKDSTSRLEIKKFCSHCNKHTLHKESK